MILRSKIEGFTCLERRDKEKELIKTIENSKKSYDEIMAFITSGDE
jgi:hypothetical protein